MAETSRDPDDIRRRNLTYKATLDEAFDFANQYMKDNFNHSKHLVEVLGKGLYKLRKRDDGTWGDCDWASWGETIIIEELTELNKEEKK